MAYVEYIRRTKMTYYAMISGRQQGPFTLDQLVEIGISPDTYVWCKGMADWQPADEVADICRAFRLHIVNLQHPAPVRKTDQPIAEPGEESDARNYEPMYDPAEHDPASPPPSGMLVVAILVTLFCFTPTGLAAIYYAVRTQRSYRKSLTQDMCDSIRHYKMWVGITLFLGLVSMGVFLSF